MLLGLSRVMTTFGGDILAWSAKGDINAGRGSKTTVLFTPPKLVYDNVGNVEISPQVPSSGAGIATLVVADGTLRVLADQPGAKPWASCGWAMPFADPLSPHSSMGACASATPTGGEVPSADSVFNERGTFEITGTLGCSRDGEGSLQRFTLEWTLTFCRVVDGTSSCRD